MLISSQWQSPAASLKSPVPKRCGDTQSKITRQGYMVKANDIVHY